MILYKGHKVYMDGDYPAIFLNGKNQHVHRLVWMEHHGEIPQGFVIHHKDENKLNWDIDNLEMLSRSNHVNHHRNVVRRGGVKVIAKKGNMTFTFNTIRNAATFCGVYESAIQRIFKGQQYQSKGWTFERGENNSVL